MEMKNKNQGFGEMDAIIGDEVLIAFAEATPGEANLTDWMSRYPAHARDLARFAAERWSGGESTAAAEDAAQTARIRDIGLSVVRSCRGVSATASTATTAATAKPIKSLLVAARERGMEADTVAAALDMPVALFWKLHRRLIAPDSIPRNLVASLAETLNRAADDVAAYLRQPPTLAAGASYRSDDAPRVSSAREDFADALRSDPETTDAGCARWLEPEVK